MSANPILVEVTRGTVVENRHRGAWCISTAGGEIVAGQGDLDRVTLPRSSVKAMQALAIFTSGAFEQFDLTDEMIALACASHNGEQRHVEGVKAFLDRIGCTADDLECGPQPPTDPAARKALREAGGKPSVLHNNCSGKHTGMLAVAKALGVPTKDYVLPDHPVQIEVRKGMAEVLGTELTPSHCGTDGCSIPTWGAPLKNLASGFARMATGEGLPDKLKSPAETIMAAATRHGFLIRGSNTLDTEVTNAFDGRLMIKIGADGVYCGALMDRGLGFALKIDDGNLKIGEVAIANVLLDWLKPEGNARTALEMQATKPITNWAKLVVGEMRAGGDLKV